MTLLAKIYPGGVQIERGVILRMQRARQIGSSAAVAAAHFQNIFPAQFNLHGDVMIKLDAGAIGFVAGRKRNGHWWFFFVSVIEKQNFLAMQAPREEWIPKPPDGLANPADGKQMVNDWHAKFLR